MEAMASEDFREYIGCFTVNLCMRKGAGSKVLVSEFRLTASLHCHVRFPGLYEDLLVVKKISSLVMKAMTSSSGPETSRSTCASAASSRKGQQGAVFIREFE